MNEALRRNVDLAFVMAGCAAYGAAALAGYQPLRLALGLGLCLFLSGYALVAALYPRRDNLSAGERLALSVGASLVLLILVGLALNYSPWAGSARAAQLAVGLFTAVMVPVATAHRAMTLRRRPEPLAARPLVPAISWRAGLGAACALLLLAGTGVYAFSRPPATEHFTAFSVLGPDGTMQSYPGQVSAGQTISLRVGVDNHEARPVAYRLEAHLGHRLVADRETGPVSSPGSWRYVLTFKTSRPGHRVLVLQLFRQDEPGHAYRSLLVHLNVRALPKTR